MMNIFDTIHLLNPDTECSDILASGQGARVERIVSNGQPSPEGFWYDQEEDEWVLLLQGTATIRFSDGSLAELHTGDHLHIPAHTRHRVDSVSDDPDCLWLAVFL